MTVDQLATPPGGRHVPYLPLELVLLVLKHVPEPCVSRTHDLTGARAALQLVSKDWRRAVLSLPWAAELPPCPAAPASPPLSSFAAWAGQRRLTSLAVTSRCLAAPFAWEALAPALEGRHLRTLRIDLEAHGDGGSGVTRAFGGLWRLSGLRELSVSGDGSVPAADLVALPAAFRFPMEALRGSLRRLQLCCGSPQIAHLHCAVESLTQLSSLTSLELYAWCFGAAVLQLPALQHLRVWEQVWDCECPFSMALNPGKARFAHAFQQAPPGPTLTSLSFARVELDRGLLRLPHVRQLDLQQCEYDCGAGLVEPYTGLACCTSLTRLRYSVEAFALGGSLMPFLHRIPRLECLELEAVSASELRKYLELCPPCLRELTWAPCWFQHPHHGTMRYLEDEDCVLLAKQASLSHVTLVVEEDSTALAYVDLASLEEALEERGGGLLVRHCAQSAHKLW